MQEWIGFVHPDDRPVVTEKLERARAAGPGEPLALEMRLCPVDGPCRWFYVQPTGTGRTKATPTNSRV